MFKLYNEKKTSKKLEGKTLLRGKYVFTFTY
jgi:hypothetical protein